MKKVIMNSVSSNNINRNRAKLIQSKLKDIYNILEDTDDATLKAVDGINMMDDLDVYIRQIDDMLEY